MRMQTALPFLCVCLASIAACREPSAADGTPPVVRGNPRVPSFEILNGSIFDLPGPPYCAEPVGLLANLDQSTTVLWTGVSKRFQAAEPTDTFSVGWKNNEDTAPYNYRTLIVGAPGDAPKYKYAWLRASQTTYGGLGTVFHVRRWRTSATLYCNNVSATIRSSDPASGYYGVNGTPATSYTMAIGETFGFNAKAKNASGEFVPVLSNDTQGNTISLSSLAIASTSAAASVGSTTQVDWQQSYADFTGVQQGTAKARVSLRGFVDSSFIINVCSPSKNVATSLVMGTPATYTLKIFQNTQFGATARNCANHIAGGAITWSSDNPSVASVNSVGLVSPLQEGSARIIAQKDGLADTTLVTVPTPQIDLSLVGPYAVRAYSSCAWQVYATVYAAGTFTYEWTKDGIPIGSNQSYVLGVPAGSTQFGIFVTVTHSSGLYPPATTSVNVTIDPNAPNCAE
jgi:hypothetical protein